MYYTCIKECAYEISQNQYKENCTLKKYNGEAEG